MKTSWLLPLVQLGLFARKATSTDTPLLPHDPETASDCADWFNNEADTPCSWVRDYFNASPQEFSLWNPSVGLDCTPWYNWNSYGVITWTKINATQTTTTTTTTSPPTSTAPTLGPSPTAWTDMDCYVEDPEMPLLDVNFNPNGDPALSVPKCWQTCYRRFYAFAGLQGGNQCWCGSYVGGEWAANQTDCNAPCTGDRASFCGGPGLLRIYRAEENAPSATATGGAITPTTTPAADARRDSGAVEKPSMFWNPLD
ncbi:WSC domain protein [Colletotrichum sojae]|uniref:WSC domain protein n=1 Tax=Colletotrichum sojae TaxID=2175907 RepID=A0A8H6MPZ2_9PEZI|nr:WSC domain protein [Colletotrichum sojae]